MIRGIEKFKQPIIGSILLLMITSLFISRGLLSITGICFFICTILLFAKEYKPVFRGTKSYFLLFTALFLISLLSGIYSTDLGEWANRTFVKLPFLLFPLAFIVLRLDKTLVFLIENLFILLVTGGTLYTMGLYYLYTEPLVNGYLQAAVLPTILDNDHIRFSWCVVIALVLIYKQHSIITSARLRFFNILIAIWLFTFLHILMSKTGLLMAYAAILLLLFRNFFKTKKMIYLGVAFLILLAPFISYRLFPTFQNRVDYMRYDFSYYSKGNYREGLSDGARVLSIKAGLSIVAAKPFFGVGYGDVETATKNYYEKNYKLKEYEKILPSSQFLLIGAACGTIGLGIALFALGYPLRYKNNRVNIYFLLFYIPALFSLLFEIHFESQFGVFIFCFFTLWFLKFGTEFKPD